MEKSDGPTQAAADVETRSANGAAYPEKVSDT